MALQTCIEIKLFHCQYMALQTSIEIKLFQSPWNGLSVMSDKSQLNYKRQLCLWSISKVKFVIFWWSNLKDHTSHHDVPRVKAWFPLHCKCYDHDTKKKAIIRLSSHPFTLKPGFHKANRELKQTDAAAERRRSTTKFPFRRTQGQMNSVSHWHHSLFTWKEIWMWPPPLGRRVSLLKLPNFDHDNDQFWVKTKRLMGRMTAQSHNCFVFYVVVVKFAVNGNQAQSLCFDSKLVVVLMETSLYNSNCSKLSLSIIHESVTPPIFFLQLQCSLHMYSV